MSFAVWRPKPVPGHCTLLPLENVDDLAGLRKGAPMTGRWPSDACFRMDPNFPKDIIVGDQVVTGGRLIVVGPGIATCTRDLVTKDLEVLPVTIFDHKGRTASTEHVLLNSTSVFDCIDTDASDIEWNDIDPTLIATCFDLVLRDDAIPEDCLMFRAKGMERVVIVRDALADALSSGDWTGINLIPIDEFDL